LPASVVLGCSPRTHHPFFASTGLASLRLPRALRRPSPATALSHRINRLPQSTTGETRVFICTRPVRPHWLRRAGTPVPNVGGPPRPDASLEVFVPCNACRPRSRCPGRPASGRSRFGVSSSSGPRARAKRTCRRDERRPCGFSLQRTCCEDARVADPRPRTFQPNPSLARRPLGGRRRGRRVDGLLSCSWSQVCRSSARVRPVEPIRSCDPSAPLSRTIPSLSRSRTTRPLERLRYKSAARHGSFAIRAFFAWRSATRSRTKRGLVGRRRSSLVHRPTALLGFVPFAGLIPHPGGRVRRSLVSRVASDAAKRSIGGLHPSAFSTFLPVRAHLSFVPARPPRLIFVGVTDRLWRRVRSAKAIGRG
jgi:hypothetical protein